MRHVLPVLILLAAAFPAAAPAATVETDGSTIDYSAASGEENLPTVQLDASGASYVFIDTGAGGLEAGDGCALERSESGTAARVACPSEGVRKVSLALGDKDDSAILGYAGGAPVAVAGGSGSDGVTYAAPSTTPVNATLDDVANDGPDGRDDTIGSDVEDVSGGDGDDTVTGSDRPNDLIGGLGRDKIVAGAGNDLITTFGGDPGSGAPAAAGDGQQDTIICGSGRDFVDADHGDAIDPDCEVVVVDGRMSGTAMADTLSGFRPGLDFVGMAGDDQIRGLGGDTMNGGSADDTLRAGKNGNSSLNGGSGEDRVIGSTGNDFVAGGSGADSLRGGSGSDELQGGSGPDNISAGAGDDRIVSRERGADRDVVRCGPGVDTVSADRYDRVSRDCEKVTR